MSFEKWLGDTKEEVEVVPTDTGKPVTGEKPKPKPAPEVPPGKPEDLRLRLLRVSLRWKLRRYGWGLPLRSIN